APKRLPRFLHVLAKLLCKYSDRALYPGRAAWSCKTDRRYLAECPTKSRAHRPGRWLTPCCHPSPGESAMYPGLAPHAWPAPHSKSDSRKPASTGADRHSLMAMTFLAENPP